MKHLKLNHLFIALVLTTALASCHKEKVDPETPTAVRAGIYILNQGNFGKNNSSLTYYDYTTKTATADIFSAANSRGLGNTANDAKIYGSKMYLIVNLSSTIEVVDRKTVRSIKQISLTNGGTPRQPRSVAFYKNNAYITSYDGTVAVLDTASLSISKYITVGNNPEQLAIANGKLYVANSGGLNYPAVDKTVSVIDLVTFAEKKITVGDDPYAVSVDSYGDVYVTAYGVFGTSNASLTIIDSKTDIVKLKTDFDGGAFAIQGDDAFYFTSAGAINIYNLKTEGIRTTGFIVDGTTFTSPYALAVDNTNGEVFVTDAKDYASNGVLYAISRDGKKEYSIETGINPGTILFVNK